MKPGNLSKLENFSNLKIPEGDKGFPSITTPGKYSENYVIISAGDTQVRISAMCTAYWTVFYGDEHRLITYKVGLVNIPYRTDIPAGTTCDCSGYTDVTFYEVGFEGYMLPSAVVPGLIVKPIPDLDHYPGKNMFIPFPQVNIWGDTI